MPLLGRKSKKKNFFGHFTRFYSILPILPKRKYKRESANPLIPLVHVKRNSVTTVYSIDED
jgi:hypothetical protein